MTMVDLVLPIEGPLFKAFFCKCSKMFECLVKFHVPGESGSSSSSSKLFNECVTWGATVFLSKVMDRTYCTYCRICHHAYVYI